MLNNYQKITKQLFVKKLFSKKFKKKKTTIKKDDISFILRKTTAQILWFSLLFLTVYVVSSLSYLVSGTILLIFAAIIYYVQLVYQETVIYYVGGKFFDKFNISSLNSAILALIVGLLFGLNYLHVLLSKLQIKNKNGR